MPPTGSTASDNEVIRTLKKRIGRQRKMLGAMNRALELRNTKAALEVANLRAQLKEAFEYRQRLDWRSACRCAFCRFREWYRYRSGEIYPGGQKHPSFRYAWRFPFSRVWWRWN